MIFRFADAVQEIRAIKGLAQKFLDPETHYLLDNLERSFDQARRGAAGHVVRVEIPADRPLRTKVSQGEYEPNRRRGAHHVVGEVVGHWDLEPTGVQRDFAQRQFLLSGNASITMRIRSSSNREQEFAAWKMEIGTGDSPGCHFHSHAASLSQQPSLIPVPRLPNILITFGDCIEFLLAELFQDSWAAHASAETPASAQWRRLQASRLNRIIEWQKERLTKTKGASWTVLKNSKPPHDLFVR